MAYRDLEKQKASHKKYREKNKDKIKKRNEEYRERCKDTKKMADFQGWYNL